MGYLTLSNCVELAANPENGWDIGSFGAIGEFAYDAGEAVAHRRAADCFEMHTARGGIRFTSVDRMQAVAWDQLADDGQGWGHRLALCCPLPASVPNPTIRHLGKDDEAILADERGAELFDLGVGVGAVRMAVRTADTGLITELKAHAGKRFVDHPALAEHVRDAQPQRVMLSPAGRIEVYQPIPQPDASSPHGPHTHLLPQLVRKQRPHAATTPIPSGLQSVLSLSPASPWYDTYGIRHAFDPQADAAFQPWLTRFGLPDDQAVEQRLRLAIEAGESPRAELWPDTRRGRAKARIVLRRLAAAGNVRVAAWREVFDHAEATG